MSRKDEPVRCGGQLRAGVSPVVARRVKLSGEIPSVVATGVQRRKGTKLFFGFWAVIIVPFS
ncbi:hypothetical protein [Chroococcidiopsis sp.]|uniref:hypothetical protein n=1 Tax=Chroococcidiopsis sp. TaxID=3088168 RepID=UPI003F672C94